MEITFSLFQSTAKHPVVSIIDQRKDDACGHVVAMLQDVRYMHWQPKANRLGTSWQHFPLYLPTFCPKYDCTKGRKYVYADIIVYGTLVPRKTANAIVELESSAKSRDLIHC